MVLEVIYVVRHGFRINWVVDPVTGKYSTTTPTPTGIPSDPTLAAKGIEQAKQLADKVMTLDPPVDVVYSSPFYRCLQTIKPSVEALNKAGRTDGLVRVDNGVSEYFGTARFEHPSPASVSVLRKHFSFLHQTHGPAIIPNTSGETHQALHDRNAYALYRIVQDLDNDPSKPRALLICTHAASMICIGRALTGQMPDDLNTEDFRCGTCALSKFVRRRTPDTNENVERWDPSKPAFIPHLDWKGGKGILGGWDCELNGDCSFLTDGEERTWHFNGDESFLDPDESHPSRDYEKYAYEYNNKNSTAAAAKL